MKGDRKKSHGSVQAEKLLDHEIILNSSIKVKTSRVRSESIVRIRRVVRKNILEFFLPSCCIRQETLAGRRQVKEKTFINMFLPRDDSDETKKTKAKFKKIRRKLAVERWLASFMPCIKPKDDTYDMSSRIIVTPQSFDAGAIISFVYDFKTSFRLNSNLIIEGTLIENVSRFAINLCRTTKKNTIDIALHLSVRLRLLNYIARNCFIDGRWENEENLMEMPCPFKTGQKFTIEIFTLKEKFLVAANGVHLFEYLHRVTPSHIDCLEIYGQVQLNQILLVKSDIYPSVKTIKNIRNMSDTAWLTPFYFELDENLGVGLEVEVEGRTQYLPRALFINLQSGSQVYPEPSIGFHFSVTWNQNNKDTVIYNSFDEKWNTEIKTSMDLDVFCPGKLFKFSVLVEPEHFIVSVNSKVISAFPIRKKSNLIPIMNTVRVGGDVLVFKITKKSSSVRFYALLIFLKFKI